MVRQIFFLLLFIIPLTAQQKQDPVLFFNKAVDMFRYGQYEQALKIFTDLAGDKSFVYQVPAEIFKAKIMMKKGEDEKAEEIFNTLKNNIRDSVYRREILLNISIIKYNQGEYVESAEELLDLVSISGTSEYYKYAKNSLDTIAVNNLTSSQMDILYNTGRKELKPLLLLLLGKSYLAEDNEREAKAAFLKVMQQYSSSPLRKEAEDFFYERKTINVSKQTEPVIALLFPEKDSSVEEIREGIKYAVHEFNSTRDDKIGIVSIDFNTEELNTIKNQLLSMNVKCLMGPVYSDEVRDVLKELKGIKIPVISPTATDNDLTQLNEYFFQANPNFTMRAKAMAQYVFYVENKRKMGVLNAIEGYSPLLATVFTEEFRQLGGEVIISQTFKSRSSDFDTPVSELNKRINEIEGMYIPVADKDDINPLLTALSKGNISIPVYANQDWFIGKLYEAFPGLTNNLIFESDYFIDYSSYTYDSFNEEFMKVAGLEAERNMLYGYDITRYFLSQVTKVNADPEFIARRMMEGNTVTGYHNNICFDEERVNKFVNIVRYRD
ncbi:MAG: amino acid ABC transporter substrate-binding protein, partial [Ignavibacteriales bacterium]